MVKWGLLAALALAVIVPASAASAHSTKVQLSALDKTWLQNDVQGDAFEIKGGKMAQSKGSDSSVKSLGSTLVKDHMKSLSDDKKIAAKLGVKVQDQPTPPESWELSVVQTMSGKSFDQWYAKLEVQDHIQDIKDATDEATSGSNPSIRAEAKKDIPVLKKHLALSRAALKKVS